MINRFISILFLIFIGITSIALFAIAFTIWILTVLFDKRLIVLHQFTCLWASIYTLFTPVSITGRKKADRFRTFVIVSNHQSQFDILVLFRLFYHFKWVSKSEIFRVPLIGWNMVLNRYIGLKRGDKESIRKMLDECEKNLAEGNSVFIFPEGTRSPDGILKPFKPGAFLIAKKLGIPILPVAVSGTIKILPKYSMNMRSGYRIKVKVLDPIPVSEFSNLSVEDLAEKVRIIISNNVE